MIFGVSDFADTDPFYNSETIVGSGMDFIEAGCAKLVALSEDEFQRRAGELKDKGLSVQSLNWFLPPDLKVVGPEVDDDKSREFLKVAVSRANTLDARAIVFGSPASRSIPDGFPADRAREQLVSFCHLCADVIEQQQAKVKLAIEHVNHTETNFINTFEQSLELALEVSRPEVGLTADFYHFQMENESSRVIRDAGELVCAVQVANPKGRYFPKRGDVIPGIDEFFRDLKAISYSGGISVEATPESPLEHGCRLAAEYLSEAWNAA